MRRIRVGVGVRIAGGGVGVGVGMRGIECGGHVCGVVWCGGKHNPYGAGRGGLLSCMTDGIDDFGWLMLFK